MSVQRIPARNFHYEILDPAQIKIDERYQRALGPGHIKDIVSDFDYDAIGVITVNQRPDHYYVMDGHHRIQACIDYGLTEVHCKVFDGLGLKREASLFLKLNFNRSVTALSKFDARVTIGEEQVLEIIAACESEGFFLKPHSSPEYNTVGAIAALDRIYLRSGVDGIKKPLYVIAQAWPDYKKGREGVFIEGLNRFMSLYPELEDRKLISKLRTEDPNTLDRDRSSLKRDYGGTATLNMARAVLNCYNKGRRSGKLQNRLPMGHSE